MRRALITAALLFAAPATATAAPFGELPFRPVSGAATCLQATGAPGELVRWVRDGAEVLEARADGLVPVTTVPLGKLRDCPAAAGDAGGAAILAAPTADGIRIALREPGGTWGAPITVPARRAGAVEVAISARGDAIVAWLELPSSTARTTRVRTVRRPAGGAFAMPEQLGGMAEREQLVVGVAGDGAAVVAIASDGGLGLATAAPGRPFTPSRRLIAERYFSGEPALAVSPDGRALLATATDDGLTLFEREPGADFVRRPTIKGASSFADVALALGPQGAAVVAWQSYGPGGQVSAMLRDAGALFAAPVLVQRDEPKPSFGNNPGGEALLSFGVASGDGPPYEGQTRLRAALGPDGRALLAWGTVGRGTRTATVTTAGGAEIGRLGSSVRDPAGVTPLLLAGGGRAIAWSDGYGVFSFAPSANRLHLAIEGAAAAPAAAAPELTIGAPRDRTLRPSQTLWLPVRCRAACDVHGQIPGQVSEPNIALARAGTALLRFDPIGGQVAAPNGKPVKVVLRWSAPGSRELKQRTFSVPLRGLPAPPLPRIENLRVRRLSGGRIDVRWSTDVAARDAYFYVYGTRTRSLRTGAPSLRVVAGRGRRSFHVTLRDAARARYVTVAVGQTVGERTRTAVIRVP
jgi:hypothetical protein